MAVNSSPRPLNPLISEKNGRDHRSLFGEDLTAVRDELAALTASAAGEAHRLNRGLTILEIVMLGLASLLGISVSITVSNRMMAGLERLIQGTRQVQDGHGYEMLPVTSNDEIGKLTVAFNHGRGFAGKGPHQGDFR